MPNEIAISQDATRLCLCLYPHSVFIILITLKHCPNHLGHPAVTCKGGGGGGGGGDIVVHHNTMP